MTSKLVNKTFLFTLVITLLQIKSETIIESNTYKPIAVQITDSTFFTFTEDISFVYDVNTGKSTNKLTHTTISSQDMQKASIICNSKNIYVSVSGTLYVYETTGELLGKANFDSDLSSASKNPVTLTLKSDYSIFAMDNGNVVVSQIVFVNNANQILHMLYKKNVLQRYSYVAKPDSQELGQFGEKISCKNDQDAFFLCFIVGCIGDTCAAALKFNNGNFQLDSFKVKIIPKMGSINVAKNGNFYAFSYTTWEGNGGILSYNSNTGEFGTPIELGTSIQIGWFKNDYSISVAPNGNFVLSGIRNQVAYAFYFDTMVQKQTGTQNFQLQQNQSKQHPSYIILKGKEALVFDSMNEGVCLYFMESTLCADLCAKRLESETEIAITFPGFVVASFKFKKLGTYGTLTDKKTGKAITTSDLYKAETLELVYSSQKKGLEEIEYFTVASGDTTTEKNKCKITINNVDGECPCIKSEDTQVLYHFEGKCVEDCPFYTILNKTDETCYSCVRKHLYLYKGECIEQANVPQNSYLKDKTYNIVEDCDSNCETCIDRPMKCLTCKKGFHWSKLNEGICIKDKGEDIVIIPTNETAENVTGKMNSTIGDYTGQVTIIKGKGYTVEITNSSLPDGNLKLSKVDFGECETILRNYYNIKNTENLVFVKIDLNKTNSLTDQVEYTVYDSSGKQLDMSLCKDVKIKVTYTINDPDKINKTKAKEYLDQGIDIYNPDDDFFTDICYPYSTERNTDITLNDRKADILENVSYCDDGCEYDHIDLEEDTITCICNVKTEINTKIDVNFFYQGLKSIVYDSNFAVVLCYNLVFDGKRLLINYGFWLFLFLTFLHMPCIIVYAVKGVEPISSYMHRIKGNPPKRLKRGATDYIENIITQNNLEEDFEGVKKAQRMSLPFIQYSGSPPSEVENFNPRRRSIVQESLFSHPRLGHLKEEDELPSSKEEDEIIKIGEKKEDDDESEAVSPGGVRFVNMIPIIPNSRRENNLSNKNTKRSSLKSGNFTQLTLTRASSKPIQEKEFTEQKNQDEEYSPSLFRRTRRRNRSTRSNQTLVTSGSQSVNNRSNSQNSLGDNKSIQSNLLFLKNSLRNNYSLKEKPVKNEQSKDTISLYSPSNSTRRRNRKSLGQSKLTTNSEFLTSTGNIKKERPPYHKPSRDFLDDFDYESAIIYDNRKFWFTYYLCLLTKQGFLQAFVLKSPLELRVIRIIIFIFSNSLDFALNALFYLESMISERYHYEGNLGFLFTLQNNLFSSLASIAVGFLLTSILDCLSNSKKKLEVIGEEEKKDPQFLILERKVLKCLKVKLFFFLFFEGCLMLFFWYYVTAFCAVYHNSQVSWLQGGLISFVIGNLIPFGVALIVALLRYAALKNRMPRLFKFSIWLYSL